MNTLKKRNNSYMTVQKMTKYIVEKILLYLWQLSQNIVGLLVILFSKAKYNKISDIWETKHYFGVSLGNYIILNECCSRNDIKHERGKIK